MITLKQLTYALAVERTLHFRKAAEACNISQSAFSTALSEMEKQLGFQVFERNNKQVLITSLGREVLIKARSIKLQMDDLQRFVENVHKDKKPRVEPLPRIKPHETFTYTASKLSDPFSSGNLIQNTPVSGGSGGVAPDLTRRREPLEQFPLDSLSMVGTLARGDTIWAVIRAPDDTIHRAQSGNYLGQNHGKIEQVTPSRLVVSELVPGGNNNWIERESSIAIVK